MTVDSHPARTHFFGDQEPSKTEQILMKGYVKELRRYPVSKLVNQVGYNKRECMKPMKGIVNLKALAGGPNKT